MPEALHSIIARAGLDGALWVRTEVQLLGTMMSELLAEHRESIAPEIVGNIELGMNVTSSQIFEAERT